MAFEITLKLYLLIWKIARHLKIANRKTEFGVVSITNRDFLELLDYLLIFHFLSIALVHLVQYSRIFH
jgi:hypothetical protein